MYQAAMQLPLSQDAAQELGTFSSTGYEIKKCLNLSIAAGSSLAHRSVQLRLDFLCHSTFSQYL